MVSYRSLIIPSHEGIGFITPDTETEDVEGDILVHYMQIRQETEDGFKSLDQGAKVGFLFNQETEGRF